MVTQPHCAVIGCGNPANDKHHIGGSGSPLIWLCRRCHGQIHGTVWDAEHTALTRAGLAKARAEGRIGGNPGLRNGDPAAIQKLRDARNAARIRRLMAGSEKWLPIVRRMRPKASWKEIVAALNTAGGDWSVDRLRSAMLKLGETDAGLMGKAAPRAGDTRLMRLVAAIATANPERTLAQIAAQLESMGECKPRGGSRWHPSSVKYLLDKAGVRLGVPQPIPSRE